MVPSTNVSMPGFLQVGVGANTGAFVLTNGQGQWDNNGGKNYLFGAPGMYELQNGVLTTLQTWPAGCPAGCGLHGTCGANGACTCSAGYWGWNCQNQCSCGPHGTCQEGGGGCVCVAPWATCPGSASNGTSCNIDLQTDPQNCGACGNACPTPSGTNHVLSSACNAGTCNVSCASGFINCPGSLTCVPGNDPSACPLPGCTTYSLNQCSGNDTETPVSFDAAMWQTPTKGQNGYMASFQSFGTLVGYPQITYDATRTTATVNVFTKTKSASVTLSYSFDGVSQSSPTITYCAPGSAAATAEGASCVATNGPVYITVTGSDGSSLVLDEMYLLWGAGAVAARAGDYRSGQKGSIVEFFGWPHAAIEQECQFLAQAGFLGAKFYPVSEQVGSWEPYSNALNPWFFAYQPWSYRFQGRMGNSTMLAAAIKTCRSLGVRTYADAVVNHMVGGGNDAALSHRNDAGSCVYWGPKGSSAMFWANSSSSTYGTTPTYTQDFQYDANPNTGLPASQEFPAVPYQPSHFHCERVLNSWTDPLDLNAGWLDGLVDLNTEHPYVQQRIADYMTSLLSIGFSGFRVDAAKHIRPDDLVAIFTKLRTNMGGSLPDDFVSWWEVLTGGEGDMLVCNNASGYNYGGYLVQAFQAAGWPQSDIDKIKVWASYYPKEPTIDCGNIAMNRKAIQNDDSDQQQPGSTSRDMGNAGCVLVSSCSSIEEHRSFEVTLFTQPPGSSDNDNDYPIRMVLSSFYFPIQMQPYGFPDGLSDCKLCQGPQCSTCTNSMPYSPAYNASAVGYEGPVYTRVHRDAAIIAAMRQWMHLPALSGAPLKEDGSVDVHHPSLPRGAPSQGITN